jgi:hypothetical protein
MQKQNARAPASKNQSFLNGQMESEEVDGMSSTHAQFEELLPEPVQEVRKFLV